MAADPRQHHTQLSTMAAHDPLRYQPPPHFTNPWTSPASTSAQQQQQQQQQLYSASIAAVPSPSSAGLEPPTSQSQPVQRPTSIAIPYHGLSVAVSPLASGTSLPAADALEPNHLLAPSQDALSRSYTAGYPSSGAATAAVAAAANTYAPTSAPHYALDFSHESKPFLSQDAKSFMSAPQQPAPPPQAQQQDPARHPPYPSVSSAAAALFGDAAADAPRVRPSSLVDFGSSAASAQAHVPRDSFDAGRSMLSLSQSDITPRNIYGAAPGSRSSTDSYGFPSTHSAHSSISSASYSQSYYNSGADGGSVTDYSSASESVDNPRTLPPPAAMMAAAGGMPPAPQSMMGQFSSKVSTSSQKKHKCKICDKRFTRPSSLQTHMYSHTGEKRESCALTYRSDADRRRSFRVRRRGLRPPLLGCVQPATTSQGAQRRRPGPSIARRTVTSFFLDCACSLFLRFYRDILDAFSASFPVVQTTWLTKIRSGKGAGLSIPFRRLSPLLLFA